LNVENKYAKGVMQMSIGYACLALGVKDSSMKGCLKKNASEIRLKELIRGNLNSLDNLINYNIESGIKMFRISSDLIPFASSPVNSIEWWNIYKKEFSLIGNKIRENKIRVSMHPGQYTVLNSQDEGVVERAVEDLQYHSRVLDSLGTGSECKIVLHIGGVYNDKYKAIERFSKNYSKLPDFVKERLVIENDDKSYNISEVLEVGKRLKVPVVFDNLHNFSNPSYPEKSEEFWINECRGTWSEKDGKQKIHYSQQAVYKRVGAHSESIEIKKFLEFYSKLGNGNTDIMLEVKDKNLSAVKCINCIRSSGRIRLLEIEWSKYKYSILEKSSLAYKEIRELLKCKNGYQPVRFYSILENALRQPENIGNALNAAMHVFGYFKKDASDKERERFLSKINKYKEGETSLRLLKKELHRLSIKYEKEYLLESYYFLLQ